MKKIFIAIILSLILVMVPAISTASPTLASPPSTLPTEKYYYYNTTSHNCMEYNVTGSGWHTFFSKVIDNHKYVKYDWANVTTQYSIIFDQNYSGLNYYGAEFISALSSTGSPTVKNMTVAFEGIEKKSSLVDLGKYTNIKALNTGAYPGFSFSKPAIKPLVSEYEDFGIIAAIIAGMIVLYFIFNRKK